MNEKITAYPQKEEREKVLKEIRQLENRQKILENKQRNEERKARHPHRQNPGFTGERRPVQLFAGKRHPIHAAAP